jgi:hypothetical protein
MVVFQNVHRLRNMNCWPISHLDKVTRLNQLARFLAGRSTSKGADEAIGAYSGCIGVGMERTYALFCQHGADLGLAAACTIFLGLDT